MIWTQIAIDYGLVYETRAPLYLSLYSRGLLGAALLLSSDVRPLGVELRPGFVVVDGARLALLRRRVAAIVLRDAGRRNKILASFRRVQSEVQWKSASIERILDAGRLPRADDLVGLYRSGVGLFSLDFLGKHAFPHDEVDGILASLELPCSPGEALLELSIPDVMPHFMAFQYQRMRATSVEAVHAFVREYGHLDRFDLLLRGATEPHPRRCAAGGLAANWADVHAAAVVRRERMHEAVLKAYQRRWDGLGCANFEGILAVRRAVVTHEEQKRYLQSRIGRNTRIIAERLGLDPGRCTIESLARALGGFDFSSGGTRVPAAWTPTRRRGSSPVLRCSGVTLAQLADAAVLPGPQIGNKAAMLGRAISAGMNVPPGFVIELEPWFSWSRAKRMRVLRAGLARLAFRTVAVRSSFLDEDGARRSEAGQAASYVGLWREEDVSAAIDAVARSRPSARGAVIVQAVVDSATGGVLAGGCVRGKPIWVIEAVPGLNLDVTSGGSQGDRYVLDANGLAILSVASDKDRANIACRLGVRRWRLGDRRALVLRGRRHYARLAALAQGGGVALGLFCRPFKEALLGVDVLRRLSEMGACSRDIVGQDPDVEWALDARGALWLLQARPLTRPLVVPDGVRSRSSACLQGIGASAGTAAGRPRLYRGGYLASLESGDVLVARRLLATQVPAVARASGIVTEQGGLLSHTSMMARELGIPCVVGVRDAVERLAGARRVRLDGTAGTVEPVLCDR